MPPLILASGSPRRRELLAQLGLDFEVMASDVPEERRAGESATVFAARVAQEKARHVANRRPADWILAADTVVVINEEVLGKPIDRAHACHMLRRLSGRTHRVVTAVTLLGPGAAVSETVVVETAVTFREITADEIAAYLATSEPFDKAGAYAIQGQAARFVVAYEGSYSNVIGLPLDEVGALCQQHGLLVVGAATPA